MKRKLNKNKLYWAVISALSIIAVAALTIIIIGIKNLYSVQKDLKDGLKYTEQQIITRQIKNNSSSQINLPKQEPSISEENIDTLFQTNGNANHEEIEKIAGSAIMTIISHKKTKIAIYDGITKNNLRLGSARTTKSAKPGEKGNCVIYGHRDSSFACLESIKKGDTVKLKTLDNEYQYEVYKTFVTTPDDSSIQQQSEDSILTLVTCYPFILSGPANDRYVVLCKMK